MLPVGKLSTDDRPDLPDLGCRPGDHSLQDFPQNQRPWLVILHVDDRIGIDHYEREPRIVGPAISVASFVTEIRFPVRLVEVANPLAIANDVCDAAY